MGKSEEQLDAFRVVKEASQMVQKYRDSKKYLNISRDQNLLENYSTCRALLSFAYVTEASESLGITRCEYFEYALPYTCL